MSANGIGGRWWGVLLAMALAGLLLAACSSATGESNAPVEDTAPESTAVVTDILEDQPLGFLTINVNMTDEGYEPASIYVPAGRRIRLILRNRTLNEHHFRILELMPKEVLWYAPPTEAEFEAAMADEDEEAEHDLHHESGFIAFRETSPMGIRPFGDEVHGYAIANNVDMVLFTATKTGTFQVYCPLHPELVGEVTVF